jgi:hypothetical protein
LYLPRKGVREVQVHFARVQLRKVEERRVRAAMAGKQTGGVVEKGEGEAMGDSNWTLVTVREEAVV